MTCPRRLLSLAVTRSALVPLVLLGLTAGGCERVKAPIEGRNDPYGIPQINFSDAELRRRTAVQRPTVSRDESGNLLHVTVPIRSTSNRQLSVEYRTTFFDANGAIINSTTWFPKTLSPNVPDRIQVNSTSERAADFQIDFRPAQ